jgi:hypothetical protein
MGARPYLEPRVPWARNPDAAAARYEGLVKAGVWTRGSNIVRDRLDPAGFPDRFGTVDMGAWLFARPLLAELGLRVEYDATDWENVMTEDDKLLDDLVARGVAVACTHRATLHYFIGGYSNPQGTADDVWSPR